MMPKDDLTIIEDEEIGSPWPCNNIMEECEDMRRHRGSLLV
jgi:hypothetical protein